MCSNNDYRNYLSHHGIIGMHWGIRRYQPYGEGGYNPKKKGKEVGEARYGANIRKMEKKAIKKAYKQRLKNGGSRLFRSARLSTGKNFDEAEDAFGNKVLNDSTYQELSRAAFNAEKKRLIAEKGHDDDYDELWKKEGYRKLYTESVKATEKKDAYVKQLSKAYVDTIKEAKLKDLNITENKQIAKKYLSDRFQGYVYDDNLEYNPDHYYEDWVEKETYKKPGK